MAAPNGIELTKQELEIYLTCKSGIYGIKDIMRMFNLTMYRAKRAIFFIEKATKEKILNGGMDYFDPSKDSLCWLCSNSTNSGCSWSKSFVPVDGWEATPNTQYIEMNKGKFREEQTYHVLKCPEFVDDAIERYKTMRGNYANKEK